MARRKKKTRSTSQFTHKSIVAAEKDHYGDEPDFTDSIESGCIRIKAVNKDNEPDVELAYLKSLNWYNACASSSQRRRWVAEYAKAELSADAKMVAALKKYPENKIDPFDSITLRLVMRGAGEIVPDVKQANAKQYVSKLISQIAEAKKAKQDKPKDTNKPSVHDHMEAQAAQLYGVYVIPLIDIAFESKGAKAKNEHKLYDILKRADVSGRVALKIVDLIQETIYELNAAYEKTDEDYVEAYSYLTKGQQKKVLDVLDSMVEACNQLNESAKRTRKATKSRRKRKPTAERLLKTFKYKAKDDEYRIASIDPLKVVGASGCVLFNTKTRKATYLVAKDRSGLQIKGASINNIDTNSCVTKTIRKPFEFIAAVRGKGVRAVKKTFTEINAKNGFKNGKVNAHTVILTVIK